MQQFFFIDKFYQKNSGDLIFLLKPLSTKRFKVFLQQLAVLLLIISCTKSIKIDFKESKYQVYVLANKKSQRIVRICFPKEILFKNYFSTETSFIKVDYQYNSINKSIGSFIHLFKRREDKLIRVSNNKKKNILTNDIESFVFFTLHYVEKNKKILKQFKPYIDKMLSENKDTLHIGTVREFKSKHGELFEKLTKNDSISIQFLEGNELGERITVPVEW